MSLSVCGEHGGDPKSIAFFDKVGLNYVSCSPYRVPVARLAAAQIRVQTRMAKAKEEEEKRTASVQPKQTTMGNVESMSKVIVQ
jgi:pyruvate,orthophosphate dikinase